jgi:hypothetical protein
VTSPALRLHTPNGEPSVPPAPRKRVPAEMIDAYWDEVEGRVGYLLALVDVERYGEAITLCATYLEAVAHALVTTDPREEQDYASEAEAHADDPYLSLVHPQQLVRVATQMMGLSAATAKGFAMIFDAHQPQLLYQDQAVDIVRSTLPPSEAAMVERVIWKCTIAYVIYDFLRSQTYQRQEGVRKVGLGSAFYEGDTVQGLSVPELVALLHGMIAEARARGHAKGRLPE